MKYITDQLPDMVILITFFKKDFEKYMVCYMISLSKLSCDQIKSGWI